MKTMPIKIMMGCLLLTLFSVHSFAQAPMKPIEEGGKMPAKIEKANVPMEVIATHVKEYPVTGEYENWYGYPAFADGTDWYGYNPYLYTAENPEYYIVEFKKDSVPHKVIYAKSGKKIATHKKMSTPLPPAVSSSVKKGEYKDWKLAREKMEIFKDGDDDKRRMFKLIVEKGKEKHELFYSMDGKLLKDKKVKL